FHNIPPSSAGSQSKRPVFSCWWLQFRNSEPCSDYCLTHLVNLLEDWGPCTEHGKHHIRIPRTPARVTGGVFLVDKNPHNTAESRLVVDFSQFSRGSSRVSWPKFAVPNLQSLTNLLSSNLSWLSLDVSAAFYHLPLHPAAMPHLLVGSSGLSRYVARLSSNSRIINHQYGTLPNLHDSCSRNLYVSLMLLFKTFGRKLHLYSHPIIMGFRKIPMGVGLSPFLLAQFTSAICSVVRRAFPHCLAFSYMDDVVLGAKSVQHLESLYTAVTNFLLSLGIHLNPNKTKRWGYSLNFMGYVIGSWGSLPQEHIIQKIKDCFRKLPVNRPIDWKVCQRIVGLLGFAAPFTQCGYPALMPLYACTQSKQAFTFSPTYKAFLCKQYLNLYPVARQRPGLCQVFADATPTGWGLAIGIQRMRGTFVAPLPIHTAELLAACFARSRSGAKLIGTDNSVVLSRKYTSFPWLLGCAANWILRGTSFVYVPSALNPADDPSRGRLGIYRPLLRLPFQPTTGRTSLYAVSPSVPSHLPDRVHFASPLHVAWRPPMPLSYQHFRRILLLDEEAGPLEEELPRLADEDLNRRVAEDLNLQLPNVSIPWTHKVGNFTGLYSSTIPVFNPNWKTPSFPDIHLHQDIINKCEQFVGPLTVNEKRRLNLVMPARFFPISTKYLPLEKGIKPYYPDNVVNHYFQTRHYLHTLWKAGILYKRETTRSASFCGSPYSWEQELHHGAFLDGPSRMGEEYFHHQSSGIFSRPPVGSSIQSKHQKSRLGPQSQQRPLDRSQQGRSGSIRAWVHSPTRRPFGVEPSGSRHAKNIASRSASCLHQSAVRKAAYPNHSTFERHSSSGHAVE
ncbi:polymerase, partial [Hepatitis B virus]